MYRFTPLFGLALLWLAAPAHAKDKPNPPAISACYGKICITDLRWRKPTSFDRMSLPAIEGSLFNGSATPLRSLDVEFALKAGQFFIDTASASYGGELPPGGRWAFHAYLLLLDGRVPSRTSSMILSGFARSDGRLERFANTLVFDPVFNPDNRSEIKQWEKVHGKRQR